MISVKSFVFNPIQVNTYILYDETKECVIIDAGMYDKEEEQLLKKFISDNNLNPVKLLNTHYHFDHILANVFVKDNYHVSIEAHSSLKEFHKTFDPGMIYEYFGIKVNIPPQITKFLEQGDIVEFGNSKLEVIHVPGHTPQCIVYYSKEQKFIIAGDVLFGGSIGRTDLPGGDYDLLISSINSRLMVLDDDVKVFSGHGSPTSIGRERKYNPFLSR